MSKIIKKSNFKVVVEPKRLGDYGSIRVSDSFFRREDQIEKDYERRCMGMVDQIKRHVDEVDNAYVDYDTEEVCSHCGYEWDENEDGEPLCCDNAIAEYKQSKESVK